MDEVARGAQAEMGMGGAIEALRLDMLVHNNRLDANADSVQGIREWVLKVQERVAALEGQGNGHAAAVNALLTRVTALEAAVAAELAPLPPMPVPPSAHAIYEAKWTGGKKKPRAKKPARSR